MFILQTLSSSSSSPRSSFLLKFFIFSRDFVRVIYLKVKILQTTTDHTPHPIPTPPHEKYDEKYKDDEDEDEDDDEEGKKKF